MDKSYPKVHRLEMGKQKSQIKKVKKFLTNRLFIAGEQKQVQVLRRRRRRLLHRHLPPRRIGLVVRELREPITRVDSYSTHRYLN